MKNTLLTLALAFSCALAVNANTREEIQNRMRDRKDAVAKLLATENAGENNAGFLAKLNDISADETKTMTDENADRKQVYALIAKDTGSTEADVGKRRAKQIADNAAAGTMIQDAAGNWKKKPTAP